MKHSEHRKVCAEALKRIEAVLPYLREHQQVIAANGKGFGHLRDAVEGLERTADGLKLTLSQPPRRDPLPREVRSATLAAAIGSYMADRSGESFALDDLPGIVGLYRTDEDRTAYLEQLARGGKGGPGISGLLVHDDGVKAELEKLGIIAFQGDDRRIRLVNTQWLTAHADIWRYVREGRRGGRCVLCRTHEPGPEIALYDVRYGPSGEAEIAGTGHTINGVTQLAPRVAYAHKACRPLWRKWEAIAAQYPTEEAAHQADVKAGRAKGKGSAIKRLLSIGTQEVAP